MSLLASVNGAARDVGLYACVDGAARKLFDSGLLSSLTPYYDEVVQEINTTGAKMAITTCYIDGSKGDYVLGVVYFPADEFYLAFEMKDLPVRMGTGNLDIHAGPTNVATHIYLNGNTFSFKKEYGGVVRDPVKLRVRLYK